MNLPAGVGALEVDLACELNRSPGAADRSRDGAEVTVAYNLTWRGKGWVVEEVEEFPPQLNTILPIDLPGLAQGHIVVDISSRF